MVVGSPRVRTQREAAEQGKLWLAASALLTSPGRPIGILDGSQNPSEVWVRIHPGHHLFNDHGHRDFSPDPFSSYRETAGHVHVHEVRHRALALHRQRAEPALGHHVHWASTDRRSARSATIPSAQRARPSCQRCADGVTLDLPCADYAYLLGLYLGDGCISVRRSSQGRPAAYIFCADAWPGLVAAGAQAMRADSAREPGLVIQCQGCTEVV